MSREIVIDPEFRDFLPATTEEQDAELETTIKADGRIFDPMIVWKTGHILVDGHRRMRIAEKLRMGYRVEEREFADRAEALEWAFKHQDTRRNWTDFERAEIAMRLKPALEERAAQREASGRRQGKGASEKTAFLANPPASANLRQGRTDEKLAESADVSANQIRKVERIKEQGTEPLATMARTGEVSIDAAAKVATLPKEEQEKVVAEGPKAVKAKASEIRKSRVKPKAPQQTQPEPPPAPLPVDPEKPWAEFERDVLAVVSELASIRIKLQKLLGYDSTTKQLQAKWTRFFSYTGTIGAINALIRYLEHSLPERLDPKPPGYISVELAKARHRQSA